MLEPVQFTPELERVIRVPRRKWDDAQAEALSDRLTPLLRTEEGARRGVRLFGIQALALHEFHQVRGGFFAFPVGKGKTLTARLLPYVGNVTRSVYLNPANLIPDREADFAKLDRDWVSPRPPSQFWSYTALTLAKNERMFFDFKPKLVIADEGDLLRNPQASMWMRLDEYLESDPECALVILTGTPMRKSIKNVCHLIGRTHKNFAPVPRTYRDRESWSNALDEKVDSMARQRPGALLQLAGPEDIGADDLETARKAFQRRLWETPGIIYTDSQSCDTPLSIRLLQAPEDPLIDQAFKHFRTKQATPPFPGEDLGVELEGPLEWYRVGNELGPGFFTHWDPLPPTPWREARKEWAKFCRSMIGRHHGGRLLATELMVARAFKDHPAHVAWRQIEPTFKPNSVARWISGSVLGYARDWLAANSPALVWTPHLPFGEALSRLARVPFYQAGGVTSDGQSILHQNPKQSAICALHSNKRGRDNLKQWTRHLSIGWPQPATDAEQFLGRPHRNGQDKPVYVDVLICCAEHLYAIDMCYREAGYVKVMQKQTQKILIASHDASNMRTYSGIRWNKDNG